MSGERLELVTDFGVLGPGSQCVLTPCGCCGSSHRFWLGDIAFPPNGYIGWEALPPTSCIDLPMACTALMVENRVLYRVVIDGLEQETPVSTEARKPQQVTR